MRLPSAGGTGDGGALLQVCCAWCLVFCYVLKQSSGLECIPMTSSLGASIKDKEKLRGRDTPPIHRRYRWWRGMLKGAVAGTSPTGP